MRNLSFSALLAVGVCLAAPVQADPAVGVGLSLSFGGGQAQTGVGIRVFSDDRQDRVVGAIGLDYQFGSGAVRGTIGPSYLGRDTYVGLDVGFGLGGGGLDFGISAGVTDTSRPAAAPPPPPPPPPPPVLAGRGGA